MLTSVLNKQLDQLFEEWESSNPQYLGKFTRDGIVNENQFQEQKLKLLFIAKEPNQTNVSPTEKQEDYRVELNQVEMHKDYSKVYSYRIAEWAHGLLNDFPPFEELFSEAKFNRERYREILQKIAFMNVKKTGGTGASNPEELHKAIVQDHKFLMAEIKIIDPDLIVLGLGLSKEMRSSLFPKLSESDWADSGHAGIKVARLDKMKIIDFYHPSVRPVTLTPAESYSLLQNIFHSEMFRKL
jgi:hypothetical protein